MSDQLAGRPAIVKLSTEAIERLNALRDGLDEGQWAAADLLDSLFAEYDTKWPLIRRDAAIELGVSDSTARNILATGQRIETDLRELYPFPFSSWTRIARDEQPREFAKVLAESADQYEGKLPPYSVVKAKLKERKNGHVETPNEIARAALGRAYDNLVTARDQLRGSVVVEINVLLEGVMLALGKVRK